MLRRSIVLLSILFALSFTAFAGIEVTPILIDLQGSDLEKQDVRVFNNGDESAYVKITPYSVVKPGTSEQRLQSIADPEKLGLLVSPRIMIIPPKQARNIRLVLLNDSAKTDRIFQVDVQPTAGKLMLGSKEKEQVGIKVLVGYGLIVIQRPNTLKINYTVHRNGNILTIKNDGNTNFILVDGKQCDVKKANCKELPVKRLYAGQTWQIKLPYETPVTYLMTYLDTSKTIISN